MLSPATCNGNDEAGEQDLLLSHIHVLPSVINKKNKQRLKAL